MGLAKNQELGLIKLQRSGMSVPRHSVRHNLRVSVRWGGGKGGMDEHSPTLLVLSPLTTKHMTLLLHLGVTGHWDQRQPEG